MEGGGEGTEGGGEREEGIRVAYRLCGPPSPTIAIY